jgi:serine/threonine protein kinase
MSLQSSPFLCNLVYAFQSSDELFLLMPFMQGGDLRYHLREHGPLRESDVRFYAAELLCGLADLHAKRVVFRDLKPENILLDAEGHLRIRSANYPLWPPACLCGVLLWRLHPFPATHSCTLRARTCCSFR